MEKEIDYSFLILDYLKSYRLYHSEEETLKLMDDIISKKRISILSSDLAIIDKEKLSLELSKLVLTQIRSDDPNKYDLTSLLPSIVKNNIKEDITVNKKLNKNLVRASFTGVITAISLTSLVAFSKNDEKAIDSTVYNVEASSFNLSNINIDMICDIVLSDLEKKNEEKTKKTADKQRKHREDNKSKILNKYTKCKTLDDILKRKKELEWLNLTAKDKIYKNCKLSAPLQRFIYEQSIVHNIPPDFTFSIIYTETRGGFNSSGEESYNAPGNYDLGLTQQNTKSALVLFCDKYNVSYDKAYKLLRDNDYVNIASAFLEYEEIAARFDGYNPKEYAGCYNGWLNWRDKSISREYVSIFEKAYNNKFTSHHKSLKKK